VCVCVGGGSVVLILWLYIPVRRQMNTGCLCTCLEGDYTVLIRQISYISV
jgi:hypothetical protein